MAKISAEEKAKKKQSMDDKIYSIFISEGWGAVTYDRLAKEFNVRKSSIQAYYPTNIMFATALQGRVFPLVIPLLDFSTKQGFINSWLKAYEDEEQHIFKEVVKMLLDNILKDGTSPHSRGAILKLQQMLAQNIGQEDAQLAIKMVFGEILYRKMHL